MNIPKNIFITNINYEAIYVKPGTTSATFVNITNPKEIQEYAQSKNVDLTIYLKIGIIGIDSIPNKIKDGISLITYTKLNNGDLRFDSMKATELKDDKTEIIFSLPTDIELRSQESTYLKILYLPDIFDDSEKYQDPFILMTPNSDFELADLKFPTFGFVKSGNNNE